MAMMDVSDLLLDPDLADPVVLVRRTETVDTSGRSTITSQSYNIMAVVVPGTQPGVLRTPDGQAYPNTITVTTIEQLQGPAVGMQPDIIQWNGINYLVRVLYDYSNFGAGFTSAACEAMSLVGETVGTPV